MSSVNLDALTDAFLAFHARFAPCFYRAEVRERSARYLRALVSPVGRKNGWQLAEAIGDPDPNGVQRLLTRARWDEDAVRDELARFVWETFGDADAGIFVLDETGFLKKGTHSVGVARQYTGTAGKLENCQIGVFLAYVGRGGTAFLDRRLYLPEHWAQDAMRRQAAHVPATVTFQTKPDLGRAMLEQAWSVGMRGGWVTGDEVYGRDGALRRWLTQQGQPSVLTVPANQHVWVGDGSERQEQPVAEVAAGLAAGHWQRVSCGDGAKGPRLYDWAWVPVAGLVQTGWGHWLLIRRSLSDPSELAYYLVAAPLGATVEHAVRVAGARWGIEQALEEAKGEAGLDEYEVRTWRSWHRHITLAMLAHACLVWLRHTDPAAAGPAGGRGRSSRRTHWPHGAGDAPALGADPGAAACGGALSPGLVGLAPPPPGRGQARALPTPGATTRPGPASFR